MKKQLFYIVMGFLVVCSNASAKMLEVNFFNDKYIGAKSYSGWSPAVKISNIIADKGQFHDKAYMSMVFAYANTTTSAQGSVSATYQVSMDGVSWWSPSRDIDDTYSNPYPYPMIWNRTTGFAPGEAGTSHGMSLWITPSYATLSSKDTALYGAGPYCPTLTAMTTTVLKKVNYMRVNVRNSDETYPVKIDVIGIVESE